MKKPDLLQEQLQKIINKMILVRHEMEKKRREEDKNVHTN